MWPESPQAKATLVAGIALALALAVFSVLQSEYFNLLAIVLFTVPLLVLSAYDIQCIVTGQCEVYSWIKTVLFLITVALSFYIAALRHRTVNQGHNKPSRDERTSRVEQRDSGRVSGRNRDSERSRNESRATGDYNEGEDRLESRAEQASSSSYSAMRSNWRRLHPGVPYPEYMNKDEDDKDEDDKDKDEDKDKKDKKDKKKKKKDDKDDDDSTANASNGADWAAEQNGSWVPPKGVIQVGGVHRSRLHHHDDW